MWKGLPHAEQLDLVIGPWVWILCYRLRGSQ